MVQNILVLIIVWTAIAYTVYQMVRAFLPSKGKSAAKCEGCTGCALKSSHKNIMELTSRNQFTIQK